MNQYHLLTEAEIDAKKNELLSQLSDEDLAMIVGELDEAEGGRFAFDPLKRQPAALNRPVQQQPKPQTKPEPKPQPKKVEPARKFEIKQTVDQLKPKEKAALVKAAKVELKKRETSPKEVKPAQPGTLKKVVKNLALAAVAAGVIGGMFGGNNIPSSADTNQQAQQVQQDYLSRPGDKGQYKILDKKTDTNNPNVTILLTQRNNTDGTVTYSVRGIDVSKNKEYPVIGTNSADDTEGLAKMRNIFANPKFDKGVDIKQGSIQSMYRNALRDPTEVKQEIVNTERVMNLVKTSPYKIARLIKQNSFDEDSVKFRNWSSHYVPVSGSENSAFLIVSGEMNGKNRFGAYVGYKGFIASIDPESGEIQKFYTEDDPAYNAALTFIQDKNTISGRLLGP